MEGTEGMERKGMELVAAFLLTLMMKMKKLGLGLKSV